jgi:hypothetical protein
VNAIQPDPPSRAHSSSLFPLQLSFLLSTALLSREALDEVPLAEGNCDLSAVGECLGQQVRDQFSCVASKRATTRPATLP